MKKLAITTLLQILVLCQCLVAGENEEFRATWVITWQLINSANSVEANKALARKILDNHSKANMNAVLWQVRQSGTAYYNSSYEPWGYYAGYKDPGYDPLAYAIQQAHTRGLELHAWFNVFATSSMVDGAPAKEHPEWVCRDRDGIPMTANRALSPGLEEVRDYTLKVAMEIVNNYDIDGLHLDYIRWNEYSNSLQSAQFAKIVQQNRLLDGMITQEQIKDLKTNASGRYLYDYKHPYSAGVPQGFSSWEEWWRWSVTEFVRVLHDSIQAVKPWVRLSVAALGKYNWSYWQGYGTVYQDAALWFNEGYIDQLTPMHYHWTTGQEFYNMLVGGCPNCWGDYIQQGISDGRLYTVGPGSYRLADDNVWARHLQIVESSREVSWVDGFQFFSYGSWRDYNYWEEAKSLFFNHRTKIRATKLIEGTSPDPPTLTLTKLDSLNYQITVIPPPSVVSDHWYAIYRSPDDNYNVANDEIIDVHFGDSVYQFTDQFSGTQDFNGTYYYFATTVDRYWNESSISNAEQTDSIPSFAPTIIATTPAEGDTIPINSNVTISFSKTMDVNTLQNSISFIPAIAITQLTWSDNHKILTIQPEGNFAYSTDYTLTVSPVLADINGTLLDGNGDGISGDAFELHFRTKAVDDVGPTILASYPDYVSQTVDFPKDAVISFLFDEIVNPTTVNDSSVVLKSGETDIPIGYLLTTVNDKSVLSIQPLDTLQSDTEYSILLMSEISDTLGNTMDSDLTVTFRTSPMIYTEEIIIDKFYSTSNWEQPDYSGSTVGIIKPNTVFEMSAAAYLPASPKRQRISAALRYEWDTSATSFLLRDYCSGSQPRSIVFDTSYVLQCYVFGDGSYNKFRFCIDEAQGSNWSDHEVSQWITIDWYGWRLLEWELSDPNSVGVWIGNSMLDGSSYRIDSFQLTHENGAAVSGTIYLDNLRLVKKAAKYIGIETDSSPIAASFSLYQNYPNPFNPTTTIPFELAKGGRVVLKVYDVLGREVAILINKTMIPGHYEVQFDGSKLATGAYLYRLKVNSKILTKQMLLLK